MTITFASSGPVVVNPSPAPAQPVPGSLGKPPAPASDRGRYSHVAPRGERGRFSR